MSSAPGGFASPNSTQTPDAIFDYWLTRLTGGELRVLLFLIRRTYGWKREQDDVSISQFTCGITDRHGKRVTEGAGISRSTAIGAVKKLLAKGLIHKTENRDCDGANQAPTYCLSIHDRRGHVHGGPLSPINTTQVPDAIFDYWLAHLSDSELAVLLYIVRRTIGFGKPTDIISPQQFCRGITTRDGVVLDEGCGVSKGKLYPALAHLVALGLITIERRIHPKKGNLPSRFGLVFAGDLPSAVRARDPRFADDPTQADRPLPKDVDTPTGIRLLAIRPGGADSDQREVAFGAKGVQGQDQGEPGKGAEGDQTGQQEPAHKLHPQRTASIQESTEQDKVSQEAQHQHHRPDTQREPREASLFGVGVAHDQEKSLCRGATASSPAVTAAIDERDVRRESGEEPTDQLPAHCAEDWLLEQSGGISLEPITLTTDDEIRSYALADDEVLINAGEGGAQVLSLRTVVCNDILATRDSYVPVRTEVYYSVGHLLGEGGDEWTPEEERKIERHNTLVAELDALYRDIAAFSLEEALGQYFTGDLVRRYAGGDQHSRKRVYGWLRYVHSEAGASLTNPAGFLRTRLASGQWAPLGATTAFRPARHRRRL